MKRFAIIGATALVALCLSATVTAIAQAEGPFYRQCVKQLGGKFEDANCSKEVAGEWESVRLKKGGTLAITTNAEKAFFLVTGTFKVDCPEVSFEKGELIGSEAGTAGTSKQVWLMKGCTVEGNGEKCEVEKAQIKTNVLETWLGKTNKTSVQGERYLVGFKPEKGTLLTTVKFKAAAGGVCTLATASLEIAKAGELAFAGFALNKTKEAIGLKFAASETFGKEGFVEFPAAELIKTEFVEKAGVVSEVKESMKLAGKNVTKWEGELDFKAASSWGVFGV